MAMAAACSCGSSNPAVMMLLDLPLSGLDERDREISIGSYP